MVAAAYVLEDAVVAWLGSSAIAPNRRRRFISTIVRGVSRNGAVCIIRRRFSGAQRRELVLL